MDYYSKSKPNLVGAKIQKTVYKIMKKKTNNSTISDKVSNMITSFYSDVIKPNKVITIVIVIIIACLIYRWNQKKDRKEQFTDEEQKIINEITNKQTAHLRNNEQYSFNPSYPISSQQTKVNYPADPLPINLPGHGTVLRRDLYSYSTPYPDLNPSYNPPNSTDPMLSRLYYTGLSNPYQCAQDTTMQNPLGYPTNFNTSTGNFVSQQTDANRNNITDYNQILNNMNGNIIDKLKLGPGYLSTNADSMSMVPPYAQDF